MFLLHRYRIRHFVFPISCNIWTLFQEIFAYCLGAIYVLFGRGRHGVPVFAAASTGHLLLERDVDDMEWDLVAAVRLLCTYEAATDKWLKDK